MALSINRFAALPASQRPRLRLTAFMKSFGLFFADDLPQGFLYASLLDLSLACSNAPSVFSLTARIASIQVDNQTAECYDPILLCAGNLEHHQHHHSHESFPLRSEQQNVSQS